MDCLFKKPPKAKRRLGIKTTDINCVDIQMTLGEFIQQKIIDPTLKFIEDH